MNRDNVITKLKAMSERSDSDMWNASKEYAYNLGLLMGPLLALRALDTAIDLLSDGEPEIAFRTYNDAYEYSLDYELESGMNTPITALVDTYSKHHGREFGNEIAARFRLGAWDWFKRNSMLVQSMKVLMRDAASGGEE